MKRCHESWLKFQLLLVVSVCLLEIRSTGLHFQLLCWSWVIFILQSQYRNNGWCTQHTCRNFNKLRRKWSWWFLSKKTHNIPQVLKIHEGVIPCSNHIEYLVYSFFSSASFNTFNFQLPLIVTLINPGCTCNQVQF